MSLSVTEAWLWSLPGLVDLALLTKAFASTWLCQECSHCISNHFHILMKSYMRFCLYFKIYMLHVALLPSSIILFLCCYYKLLSHCPRLISEYPVDKIELVWVAR